MGPVEQIAKLRGDADPADTCLTLMAEEGGRIGGIFHTMSEDDVRLTMKQPWVSIASDGAAIKLDAKGFLNEARAGLNRVLNGRLQEDRNLNFWGQFGITNYFGGSVPNNSGSSNATVSGFTTLGGPTNNPQSRWDITLVFADTLTWQHRKHSIKFGAEYRAFRLNMYSISSGRGGLAFTAAASAPTSGYSVADMLLGYPTSTNNYRAAPFHVRPAERFQRLRAG